MVSSPEAFVLLSLPDATLKSTDFAEVGVLNLECITLPIPGGKSAEECTVYLILQLNNSEIPINLDRVVERTDVAGTRTYTFAQTPSDLIHLILTLKGPQPGSSGVEFLEKLDTFDNILEQYVVNFKGAPTANSSDLGACTPYAGTFGIGPVTSNKNFRSRLVMVSKDTREVVR